MDGGIEGDAENNTICSDGRTEKESSALVEGGAMKANTDVSLRRDIFPDRFRPGKVLVDSRTMIADGNVDWLQSRLQ